MQHCGTCLAKPLPVADLHNVHDSPCCSTLYIAKCTYLYLTASLLLNIQYSMLVFYISDWLVLHVAEFGLTYCKSLNTAIYISCLLQDLVCNAACVPQVLAADVLGKLKLQLRNICPAAFLVS